MSTKTERIEELLSLDTTGHLRRLHDQLLGLGLKTRMPSNSKTLLFEVVDRTGKKHGLAAMRSGYVSVFSFPKTYWTPRRSELDQSLSSIGIRHFVETQDSVSESQYSAKQVRISDEVANALTAVVNSLMAQHCAALQGDA